MYRAILIAVCFAGAAFLPAAVAMDCGSDHHIDPNNLPFQRKLARSQAAAQRTAARIRARLSICGSDRFSGLVPYKGNRVSPFVKHIEIEKSADAARHERVLKRAKEHKEDRENARREWED